MQRKYTRHCIEINSFYIKVSITIKKLFKVNQEISITWFSVDKCICRYRNISIIISDLYIFLR